MTTVDFMKKNLSVDEHRTMKMKMLRKEFGIIATKEEIEHMNSLKTEIAIDRYFHTILDNHWD